MELPPSRKFSAKRWRERGEYMLRRIGLSLGLLVSIVVMLPFATSTAHNLRSQLAARSHRFHHHSRSWWRRHRAQVRRRQAMLARRRAVEANSRTGSVTAAPTKALAIPVSCPGAFAFPFGAYRTGFFRCLFLTAGRPDRQ